MNIVSGALRRPVSLIIAVTTVVLGGLLAVHRMPRDIFPELGVPTIYVAQTYGGMDPAQMEGFIVNYYEYHFLYISGIEHIESKSIQGIGLIKLQFHPGTDMSQAMAETVSYVDRSRAFMPPGTLPPFVLRFDAGSVPIGNLVFSSTTHTVAELQDAALNRVRPMFATLPGVSAPPPFGSAQRTIVINADPEKLRSYNMPPEELVQALSSGNIISPSGNVTIGNYWPMVPANTVVHDIKELNDVPIRADGAKTIFLRDVGTVEDSADIQTSFALVDGRRTVYIPVTKRADASTLAVVELVRNNLSRFQAMLPDGINVSYQFDQSAYVTRAIGGLVFEGGIGAVLTGLMVLLFLRDWRSALIVVLNIPLAILWASLALWLSGQTVNIMTLGGLALAVGILVDEATVTIENVHVHLARGDSTAVSARDATTETTAPRFLAMLCILAVFIPAFFMTGAARNLFVPLSLAVGFSMIGSYLLSSTLVPVLSVWLLKGHEASHEEPRQQHHEPPDTEPRDTELHDTEPPRSADSWGAEARDPEPRGAQQDAEAHGTQHRDAELRADAEARDGEPRGAQPEGGKRLPLFERFRRRYLTVATVIVARSGLALLIYLAISLLVIVILGRTLGTEIFPQVDTGQFKLRLRAPAGTRIERTEQIALKALELIKREVGPQNVLVSLGFIGSQPPNYAINTIYLWSPGSQDAIMQVQLDPKAGIRVEDLKETLRRKLPAALPGVRVSFQPSDIVSQVMSFGASTPIEVAVSGTDVAQIRRHAQEIEAKLLREPMLRDQGIEQELDFPIVKVDLARDLAGVLGVTAGDIGQALTAATSSSRYVVPNYWADSKSGVGYQVQVEIPAPQIASLEEVELLPIVRRDGRHIALRDLATVTRDTTLGEFDRYNSQRMVTLSANIAGEDLGGAAQRVRAAIAAVGPPPKQVTTAVRGQVRPMEQMFGGLQSGLGVAVGAILLLLTAYFQSWRLAVAVVLTIPAVVAGVTLMLWLTHTTLNIQSYMGTIMAVGVAVANSILLVTFAERTRMEGREPADAALEGAGSRLRPIVMTGAAMIAGTIPMALGLGEGGEQTAPLGRAVIGGLGGALCATLLALPAIFAMLMAGSSRASASLDPGDPSSPRFDGGNPPTPGHGDEHADSETEMVSHLPGPDGVLSHSARPGNGRGHDGAPTQGEDVGDGEAGPSHASVASGDGHDSPEAAAFGDDGVVRAAGGEYALVARIKASIDLSDRARVGSFGERAQRAVVDLASRVLTQAQSEGAVSGRTVCDVLAKARRVDPAALGDGNALTRLFLPGDARFRRFAQEFRTAASQIDGLTVDLDRERQRLRSDLARLDALYRDTVAAIEALDAHITAGNEFVDGVRAGPATELEAAVPPGDGAMTERGHLDAVEALHRLERRIFYLQQTRRIAVQTLAQIRLVQSGDETLIENLEVTTDLAIPAWKQKMILLIALNRRQAALELLKSTTDAADDMVREASAMTAAQTAALRTTPAIPLTTAGAAAAEDDEQPADATPLELHGWQDDPTDALHALPESDDSGQPEDGPNAAPVDSGDAASGDEPHDEAGAMQSAPETAAPERSHRGIHDDEGETHGETE